MTRLIKAAMRLADLSDVRRDAAGLIVYGAFLGFAGSEWYGILVSHAGTLVLFGWVIGAAAAVLLAENLKLSGRLRELNPVVDYREPKRSCGDRVFFDVVGGVILISMALYVREFPEFAWGFAAQTIVQGIALMVVPTAALIAAVRFVGCIVRLGRGLRHSRLSWH